MMMMKTIRQTKSIQSTCCHLVVCFFAISPSERKPVVATYPSFGVFVVASGTSVRHQAANVVIAASKHCKLNKIFTNFVVHLHFSSASCFSWTFFFFHILSKWKQRQQQLRRDRKKSEKLLMAHTLMRNKIPIGKLFVYWKFCIFWKNERTREKYHIHTITTRSRIVTYGCCCNLSVGNENGWRESGV